MLLIDAPIPWYMGTAKLISDGNATNTGSDTLVQQHFREEQDINNILKRFGVTAQMPSGVNGGMYGDFTDVQDYEDALARISRAQEGFMTLPPEVRERFKNNPGELVRVAGSMEYEDFQAMVYPPAPPPAAPAPMRVEVVNPVGDDE